VQAFTFVGSETEPALFHDIALNSSRTMPRLYAGGGCLAGWVEPTGRANARPMIKLRDAHSVEGVSMFSPADIRAGR
jgi:hypothetical protein